MWVGTRFIACKESGAPKRHIEHVIKATVSDTTKTLIYTGRPLRTFATPYVKDFETRPAEIAEYCAQGIIPIRGDYKKHQVEGREFPELKEVGALLMGQAAGAFGDKPTAKAIVEGMVMEAIERLRTNTAKIGLSRL